MAAEAQQALYNSVYTAVLATQATMTQTPASAPAQTPVHTPPAAVARKPSVERPKPAPRVSSHPTVGVLRPAKRQAVSSTTPSAVVAAAAAEPRRDFSTASGAVPTVQPLGDPRAIGLIYSPNGIPAGKFQNVHEVLSVMYVAMNRLIATVGQQQVRIAELEMSDREQKNGLLDVQNLLQKAHARQMTTDAELQQCKDELRVYSGTVVNSFTTTEKSSIDASNNNTGPAVLLGLDLLMAPQSPSAALLLSQPSAVEAPVTAAAAAAALPALSCDADAEEEDDQIDIVSMNDAASTSVAPAH